MATVVDKSGNSPTNGVDRHRYSRSELVAPSSDSFAVTPDDNNDLPQYARALYIGSSGDVKVDTLQGKTVLYKAVPTGAELSVRAKRVRATNTTATDIVAML